MELDDKILQNAMKQFGFSKEVAKKIIQKMVNDGMLQKNEDPSVPFEFKLTTDGSKFAEKTIIEQYGEFKKVIDHKGIAYRVPTIIIMREGINEEELSLHFPLWDDDEK